MSVQADDSLKSYPGNGAAVVFDGPRLFDAAHLSVVEVVDATRVESSPTYTLTNVGINGPSRVELAVATPVGSTLLLRRTMPYEQSADFTNQQTLLRRVIEATFDVVVMQIQQVAEGLGRALRLGPNVTGVSVELPTPVPNALLGWNSTGTALANAESTLTSALLRQDLAASTAGLGSRLVRFLQTGAGAFARWVEDKLRERVSVLDFIDPALHAGIRDGTNTTDLLPSINAALTHCATMMRAKLVFTPGDYRVSGPVVASQTGLCLEFEGRARLVTTSATAHILVIGDGTSNPANMSVTGPAFTSTVPKTDGACLYVRNGNDVRIEDVICATNVHDGFVFEGGPQQFGYYLERFLITGFSGDGIRQQAGSGIGVQDVHIGRGVIDGGSVGGTVGHRLLSGGGTYANRVDIIRCDINVLTAPGPTDAVNYSFFDQVIADTAISDNWSLQDGGGVVLSFNLSNCWGNTGARGFYSGGTAATKVRNVTVSNSVFANNTGNGIQLDRTDNHIFTACQIGGNNTSNAPGGSGVLVAPGCYNWKVVNSVIDRQWFAGINGHQYYGIHVVSGLSDDYVITGNTFRNAITANLLDQGSGTNKVVGGNVGASVPVIAPTFQNAWVNFDAGGAAGNAQAGYWKDQDGIVHLRGLIRSGVVASAAFTLPAGYRPESQLIFAVSSNSLHGEVYVKPDGQVIPQIGSNANFSLAGITFRAG